VEGQDRVALNGFEAHGRSVEAEPIAGVARLGEEDEVKRDGDRSREATHTDGIGFPSRKLSRSAPFRGGGAQFTPESQELAKCGEPTRESDP